MTEKTQAPKPTDTTALTAAAMMAEIDAYGSPEDALSRQRFFKTAPGEYGAGDVFVGTRVPIIRRVAGGYRDLAAHEVSLALGSPIHEHRLAGLIVMVTQFLRAARERSSDPEERLRLHDTYLAAVRAGQVNNWDLVDASAEYLVGEYLRLDADSPYPLIENLCASASLWERRVGVLATFAYIKAGDAAPIWWVAERLLGDSESLIHKAVGWMLREAGKKVSRPQLIEFLDQYAPRMPRTMLSYAVEHLSPEERAAYRAMPRQQ